MLTETISEPDLLKLLNLPADIETVEYPPEVVDAWCREVEITNLQIAAGEDRTIETLAEKLGFDFDKYAP